VSLEERFAELVRDAVEPMLHALEQRLVERLDGLGRPPEPNSAPDLMTAKDLADYLRVDPRTVQRMAAAGELPAPIPVSAKRSRWRRADIDAWLQAGGAS